MLSGELYNAADAVLVAYRMKNCWVYACLRCRA
ncbi:maltose acetyltransferase domain-containing protein [Paenibacillus sp. MCAF9]